METGKRQREVKMEGGQNRKRNHGHGLELLFLAERALFSLSSWETSCFLRTQSLWVPWLFRKSWVPSFVPFPSEEELRNWKCFISFLSLIAMSLHNSSELALGLKSEGEWEWALFTHLDRKKAEDEKRREKGNWVIAERRGQWVMELPPLPHLASSYSSHKSQLVNL